MQEIVRLIPGVDAFLALEPEELGVKFLLAIKAAEPSFFSNGMFAPASIVDGLCETGIRPGRGYPRSRLAEVTLAAHEAFSWLENVGLIVPAASTNSQNGWRVLSRRAKAFTDEASVYSYQASSRLPKAMLHPTIRDKVWLDFARSDFDTAVFKAMKQVEVSLRAAIKGGDDLLGVKLARTAFHPESGALTDKSREGGERQARMDLFAGALGSYKNPQSHRHVALSDPNEAIEQVLLANHLLRIIDSCVE